MRVRLAMIVAVLLWGGSMWLGATRPAWAASRHTFPHIRADELLRGADHRNTGDIDAIYLYGTLSLIERPVGPHRIDVAKTKHRHLLPLATLDIYHDIQTYAQTEFSDYTIWGLLADFMFHEAGRVPHEVRRSRAMRKVQAVQRRHGRQRSSLAYPDPLGRVLANDEQRGLQVRPGPPGVGGEAPLLGMQSDQPLFDLRGDHVFTFEEPVRHHGEQRQLYAQSDFHAGRGGRNYHPKGVIAQTLQRILQAARFMLEHKALAIAGLGIAVVFIKMTQNMLARPR